MFSKNFYPTPITVAYDMCKGVDGTVLEPSAGKGDLLKPLNNKRVDIHCIEIIPELQAILKENYKVIHNDFMTFKPDSIYNYILMNPPFESGVKHLLKAIDISRGAEIRCLLNSETLRNPHTKERELLLRLLEDNQAEVRDLGKCFRDAERHTDVNVSMVIFKSKADANLFEFTPVNGKEKTLNINELKFDDAIARYDKFQNMEDLFQLSANAMRKLVEAKAELEFYSKNFFDKYQTVEKIIKEGYDGDNKFYYNKMVSRLRTICWDAVLEQSEIKNFLTTKMRDNFHEFQKEQGNLPFTAENIENIVSQLYQNREEIAIRCVEESFDLLTKYHKENRCYIEGWKTNDAWKVNRKVILPLFFDKWNIDTCSRIGIKSLPYSSTGRAVIDVEKSLCIIVGKKYEDINSIVNVLSDTHVRYGELAQSEFFDFRIYKKGTIHMAFRDEYIWEQFNIIACKSKNWLKGA